MMDLLGGKMTQGQYYEIIGEKINKDSTTDVDFLSMLRLIFLYDKKLNNNSKDNEFASCFDDAIEAYYTNDEEGEKKILARVLNLCSKDTQNAFLNAENNMVGLFNIHNGAVENKISDKKETIKEARAIENREYETDKLKVEYIRAKEDAESVNKMCYDKFYFNSVFANRAETNLDKLMSLVKIQADTSNSKLSTVETKYFDRVIEDVVAMDCRLKNLANDTKIANI